MSLLDGGGRRARILEVRGGAGGIEASRAEVLTLADRLDRAGDELRDWAGLGARVLADPDLLTSAPFSPTTFAAAEAAVLAATAGSDGLLVESAGCEADARLIRAALAALDAADDLGHAAMEELHHRLGVITGLGLRPLLPVAPLLLPLVRDLPLEQWAVDHPGLTEQLVNAGGGLLAGLLGAPFLVLDTNSAAGLLAQTYSDGPHRTRRRPDLRVPASAHQPDSLEELIDHLREVAALSPDPDSADNGTIEIQSLDPGTDRARHIVYLPGTDDLDTVPWSQDHDVRDLGTNLRLVGGLDDAYRRGIVDALTRAGIRPGEPVLLVGHSQGGMEAMAILADRGEHPVTEGATQAVTAGSPTAQVRDLPADSRALSLEHRGDVVPLLDGEPNPDSLAQTTVSFDNGPGGSVEDNHGYRHYVAGAAAADASDDPSIVAQLDGLREQGFLAGAGPAPVVASQIFQIVRSPR